MSGEMKTEQFARFMNDMVNDGWDLDSEPWPRLTKQGWIAHANGNHVSMWGPDGLAIHDVPEEYDWEILQGKLHECGYCKAKDVKVSRVGFAGRCCDACIAEVRKKVEFPGWTN